jgi:hypothetical protein
MRQQPAPFTLRREGKHGHLCGRQIYGEKMEDLQSQKWDLFISHASEDKQTFVAPLAAALTAFGVNVWYDEYALRLGDSLSRSIDAGLARSDFGLVVLSKAFFKKNWPARELSGLVSREMTGRNVILPIWHQVGFQDVVSYSPPLADKFAINSDSMSVTEVAVKIIEKIRPDLFTHIQRRTAYIKTMQNAEVSEIALLTIKEGPIRHPTLPDDLVGRIRLVRACLPGVYTDSMDSLAGRLPKRYPILLRKLHTGSMWPPFTMNMFP